MKSTLFYLLLMGGTLLSSCTSECKYEDCSYHGLCITGNCECDPGFSGDRCQHIIPPTEAVVEEVDVKAFPTYKNGESWDDHIGNPDIYYTIEHKGVELYHSDAYEDAAYGVELCEKELEVALPDAGEVYVLKFYDQDPDENMDEYMGQFEFVPFALERGLNDVLYIKEGGFNIEMHIRYIY